MKDRPSPPNLSTSTKPSCRYCGSEHVIRYGRSGKRQAYWCKACKRKFTLREEGFEGLRKGPEVVAKALDLYFKGLSLRKVAEHITEFYGVPVSHQAVYKWVKNYVQLIKDYVEHLEPQLSGRWYADEMALKVGGEWRWLWNVMDEGTRFLIASVVSSKREVEDARRAFQEAKRVAKSRPEAVITDGLHAYEEAFRKEFFTLKAPRTQHLRHARLQGDLTTNLIERLQGTVREREKVLRGLKVDNTPILDGYWVYYNWVRPHQALGGRTPAEAARIGVGRGKHAWLALMLKAAIHRYMKERGLS